MEPRLDPETAARVDRHWADTLGCLPGALREQGLTLATLPPDGPSGIAIFDRQESRVVAASPDRIDELRPRRAELADLRPNSGDVAGVLGPAATVLGPQRVAYATEDSVRRVRDANTRTLTSAASEGVEALRKRCGEEWTARAEDIAFETHDVLVGRFLGDEIVAVAAYRADGEDIAHVTGIVDPAHRSRGFGTAVISAATADALEEGYIAECRPLASWETAVDVGEFLGFMQYGTAWRIIGGTVDDTARGP